MDQKTTELVISALEAQKDKLNSAIAELKASLNGRGASKAAAAEAKPAGSSTKVVAAKPKRRMSAAARKALSDSAKRRWAKAKKAGKSTL